MTCRRSSAAKSHASQPQSGREFYMEGRQAENNILPISPRERAEVRGLRLTG